MQVHLYDFRWFDEGSFEFQASLGARFAKKPLKIGDRLSMQINSDIKCAGSYRDEVFKPCPDQVYGKKKCDTCRAREGSFIFTAFDGFNTDHHTAEDLARIAGEHVVYLALFDKGLVKVGVSKLTRKSLRQIEQGSQATLYVAQTDDGVKARQIETLLRRSGMADKVNASVKKDYLLPVVTKDEAEAELRGLLEEHKAGLDEYPALVEALLDSPEFIWWEDQYNLPVVRDSSKSLHSVKLTKGEMVSGTIIAAKGPFIVLDLPYEIVSICAKDLVGYEIEFDDKPDGLELNQALQGALF